MASASPLAVMLLQAVARTDTIIARTIPERGLLDWTNGILQLVMLLVAIVAIVALTMLFVALRTAVRRVQTTVDQLSRDVKPMLTKAEAMVTDASEMVARVRQDVERVTDAAAGVADHLLDAAEVTARRVDEVNAVLDVLQDELEETVLSAAAAVRGVRVGARALATGLTARRRRRRRASEVPADDAATPDAPEH